MPWYKIVMRMKTGHTREGARQLPQVNKEAVRAYVWRRLIESLGTYVVDELIVEKLPADHPDVVRKITRGG